MLQTELNKSWHIIETLSARHFDAIPLPSEELRLHVGMSTSQVNFLAQGINSSERILEIFGTEPKEPVLDWGCGSGRTWRWLRAYPAWREMYYGCDVDAQAVEWLQQHESKTKLSQDQPPLPFEDGQFAGLYGFSILTHIHPESHRAWYAELRRILRPGGRAYITTHGTIHEYLSPKSLENYKKTGWIFQEHEGHYKDEIIVSEEFTRKAVEGLFEVENYTYRGYQNQDGHLLKRIN